MKSLKLIGLALSAILLSAAAHAGPSGLSVTLKQVQASGSQIDLLFDGKVNKNQIRTEFFNDVIQLSLNDVSVYPAKISSVNGGNLVKIFAYQYAPRLVRCRLTVKGKADDYKNRLQLVPGGAGKMLTIRIADSAAPAEPAKAEAPAAAPEKQKVATSAEIDPGKAALLEHVITDKISASAAEVSREPAKKSHAEKTVAEPAPLKERPLAGGKALPSPLGVMGKLAAVIGLFGVVALILKKFSTGFNSLRNQQANKILGARLNAEARSGARAKAPDGKWSGIFGQLAQAAGRGLKNREKMIDVVSNHYLGPKKSIAVVKVMGRTLVLGVTNDSINLITQIGEDDAEWGVHSDDSSPIDQAILGALTQEKPKAASAPAPQAQPQAQARPADRALKTSYGQSSTQAGFESLLRAEANRPAALNSPAAAVLAESVKSSSVRNQIRSRLEGLKQL